MNRFTTYQKNSRIEKIKFIFLLFLTFVSTASFAQTPQNINVKVDSLYSKILKEERKVFVHVPTSNSIFFAKETKYPVVYLLDPENHFNAIAAIIHELSEDGVLPEMIIVGITNTDRTRDLTPTHVGEAFYHDKLTGWDTQSMKTSGGGENFTMFIEKELMPHVDSLYPTAPYHLFIGHSFGGLEVIHSLFNHSNLFNSYIAIDPSFWWDDQKMVKQIEKDIARKRFDGKTLYLGIANSKPANIDTLQMKKDTTPYTVHTRFNFRFNEILRANKQTHLQYSSQYYNDDDHGSVPIIATYDGLRFIFKSYKMTMPSPSEALKLNVDSVIRKHFDHVSKQLGYTMFPSLTSINDYGYYLLYLKLYKQAQKVFQLNIDNYPSSWAVYDSMGDCYKEIGEKEKAIEQYTKALSITDFPDTKIKLEALKTGK
jgi:predicted alpha/beta superfamily hydrolase